MQWMTFVQAKSKNDMIEYKASKRAGRERATTTCHTPPQGKQAKRSSEGQRGMRCMGAA